MKIITLLFLLAVLLPVYVAVSCRGNISLSEYNSLELLFNHTNGPYWIWNKSLPVYTKWTFSNDQYGVNLPCTKEWQGINCTSVHSTNGVFCAIQSLTLVNFNLSGTLSNGVGGLSFLQSLDLSNNFLRSSIPTGIASLINLVDLALSYNLLTGSISSAFGDLRSLQNLYLNNNTISGQIPSSLGMLSQLQYLVLYFNSLTNLIPSSLFSMPSLTHLQMFNNQLSGFAPSTGAYTAGKLTVLSLYSNMLVGSLPPQLGDLTALTVLILDTNKLSSSIPDSFGSLTKLSTFYIFDNHLTGTIPTALGNMVSCIDFEINLNSLSGSVPTELGALSKTIFFYLFGNNLDGTIPTQLSLLTAATELLLYGNRLTGPIPTALSKLSAMSLCFLYGNFLTGTLPSQLLVLADLTQLDLTSNLLSGPISSAIGGLVNLQVLYLGENYFSGSLPSQLGSFKSIQALYLYGNLFTGVLPTTLANLDTLQDLQSEENCLNGTIPAELGSLPNLQQINLGQNSFTGSISSSMLESWAASQVIYALNVSFNQLTGPIPTALGLITTLTQLVLSGNSFTGSMPSSLGALTGLSVLDMVASGVTGSLPDQLGQLTSMSEMLLSGNRFVGGIPSTLANLRLAEVIDLSDNVLTGTIPSELGLISSLRYLNLSVNSLTGPLSTAFNGLGLNFRSLSVLDLSQNSLTGTIPDTLFVSHGLATLCLYSNCFSGSIPGTICDAQNLTTVVLDGLSSGSSCLAELPELFALFLKGTFSKQFMQGSIPPCMWELEMLQTLHIAGNGFTGTLGDIPASSQLTDLALGNNQLVGSIPLSIQTKPNWHQLGLASNKLTGTLSQDFAIGNTTIQVNLYENRLSGKIPTAITNARPGVVDVLLGNSFSCTTASTIPQSDPFAASYVCGSDGFNTALYVWVTATLMALACIAMAAFEYQKIQLSGEVTISTARRALDTVVKQSARWWRRAMDVPQISENYTQFELMMRRTNVTCAVLLVAYLVVCLPAYLVVKLPSSWSQRYTTVEVQNAWVTTCAFQHDILPPLLLIVFVCASVAWVVIVFIDTKIASTVPASVEMTKRKVSGSMSSRSLSSLSILLSISRVGQLSSYCTMHTLKYIVATLVLQATNFIMLVTIDACYIESVFIGLDPTTLFAIQGLLGAYKVMWSASYIPWAIAMIDSERHAMIQEMYMNLFNFIGAPCVACLATSSACMYFAFNGEASVNSSYALQVVTYETCSTGYSTVDGVTIANTTCSPVYQQQTLTTTLDPTWVYSYQCASSVITNYVPVLMYSYAIAGFVIPIASFVIAQFKPEDLKTKLGNFVYQRLPRILSLSRSADRSRPRPVFRGSRFLLKILVDFAVLLTFGIGSPLLAVTIVIAMFAQTSLMRWLLGRYLDPSLTAGSTPEDGGVLAYSRRAQDDVERATEGANVKTVEGLLIIVRLSSCLWGVLVFDMVGDVYGNTAGGWSVGVAVLLIWSTAFAALEWNKRYVTTAGSLRWWQATVTRCAACLRSACRCCCGLLYGLRMRDGRTTETERLSEFESEKSWVDNDRSTVISPVHNEAEDSVIV